MIIRRVGPLSCAKIAAALYAVMGLISGAIGAALYNLFAGMVGGIEVEIQQ